MNLMIDTQEVMPLKNCHVWIKIDGSVVNVKEVSKKTPVLNIVIQRYLDPYLLPDTKRHTLTEESIMAMVWLIKGLEYNSVRFADGCIGINQFTLSQFNLYKR